MARGWESKSVEDQIGAAEAERAARRGSRLSAAERERRARRQSLLLSRSRTNALLERATNERHRIQLRRALEHLHAQLQALDTSSNQTEGEAS
jgi:hypothetical protein